MSSRYRFLALLGCALIVAAAVQTGSATGRPLAGGPKAAAARASSGYQSVLFWLSWDGGALQKIPWKTVTQVDLFALSTCVGAHVPYADCAGPTSLDSQNNSVYNVGAFVRTVHQHSKLAMISIGGSGNPNWYYPCSPSHVAAFAQTLVGYMRSHGFDGIDLDIEQDSSTGHPAFTASDLRACTKTVRADAVAAKTARGRAPLITSDVDPTIDFDIGRIQNPYIDQFNAMSYGVKGSALASQIKALETKSAIPARKITAGLDIGDYPPPQSDCAGTAHYAAANHLAGVMLFYGQADAPSYSCLNSFAPYLG